MAKITVKINKSDKSAEAPPLKAEVVAKDAQQEAPAVAVPLVEAKLGEAPPIKVVPPQARPAQVQVAKPTAETMQKVRILRTQAAPEVGKFSFLREFKVAKIAAGQVYTVPLHVADHLQMNRIALKTL
jgi:hypothetical protein